MRRQRELPAVQSDETEGLQRVQDTPRRRARQGGALGDLAQRQTSLRRIEEADQLEAARKNLEKIRARRVGHLLVVGSAFQARHGLISPARPPLASIALARPEPVS